MRPLLLVPFFLLAACEPATRAEPAPAPPKPSAAPVKAVEPPVASPSDPAAYTVPERTDEALAALLDRTCSEAAEREQPWLVEVTAPWCGDCRALAALEAQAPLSDELARWSRVQINIGDFDRHEALRKWLHVRAIAQWSVLSSSECAPALGRAPILEQRTLEPRSGAPVTAERLAEWLEDARTAPPP